MASQPIETAAKPEVVGEIILLHPDQIDATDRLRDVDPDWIEGFVEAFAVEGQFTAIQVCRLPGHSDYKLVSGAHRHAAAAKLGMMLRCEVVTNEANERRIRETSENLLRRDLTPLERATFVAELTAAHKVRAGLDAGQDGRTASINARWQKVVKSEADDTNATIAFVYGWADETADSLGFSRRTVYNDLLLIRRLAPSVIKTLRDANHPILRNATQLRALAKLDHDQQRKAADGLIAGAKNVAAVFAKPKRKDDDTKLFNAFTSAFARMSPAQRKSALNAISNQIPAGWTLAGPEQPEAQS